ncbi:MAG: hypothetical protein HY360_18515 [Verrucomicrobia bacterium]|nr:hypothetical protein [Verrucomicrobiota bacterium]
MSGKILERWNVFFDQTAGHWWQCMHQNKFFFLSFFIHVALILLLAIWVIPPAQQADPLGFIGNSFGIVRAVRPENTQEPIHSEKAIRETSMQLAASMTMSPPPFIVPRIAVPISKPIDIDLPLRDPLLLAQGISSFMRSPTVAHAMGAGRFGKGAGGFGRSAGGFGSVCEAENRHDTNNRTEDCKRRDCCPNCRCGKNCACPPSFKKSVL